MSVFPISTIYQWVGRVVPWMTKFPSTRWVICPALFPDPSALFRVRGRGNLTIGRLCSFTNFLLMRTISAPESISPLASTTFDPTLTYPGRNRTSRCASVLATRFVWSRDSCDKSEVVVSTCLTENFAKYWLLLDQLHRSLLLVDHPLPSEFPRLLLLLWC